MARGSAHLKSTLAACARLARASPCALLLALSLLAPTYGWAAAFGSISGAVQDVSAKPVAGARVRLLSSASGATQTVTTGVDGRFNFPNVELGTYRLSVSLKGYLTSTQPVTIESGYFPHPHIVLRRRVSLTEVTVTAMTEPPPVVASMTPITLVSGQDIARTPGAANVNSLAMITDYVPGAYEAHDMLHIRGGHQTSWLVDGVEIPNTNIAESLGPAIDPKDIQTLAAERGGYGADEGDRTYGIFNVIPNTGFSSETQAVADLTAGNFGQTDDYLSAASHTQGFAYYASLEGNRSDLGLQTPVSQVIHDQTQGHGAFINLQYAPGLQDEVSVVGQLRQDDYQIPDCIAPLADDPVCVGQFADEQREADNFALLSWAHTFTGDAVLTSSLLYHFERADYDGGAHDFPIITTFHHGSQYEGGEENLRMQFGRHHLDAGVYGFAQQDRADFGLARAGGGSKPIAQQQSPRGELIAAWLQDTFEATRWLSLTAGVRQSHFRGLVTESATDPRLGATVKLPHVDWVLSAFWGRYYQPPPLETLAGPFIEYATAQDTSFLPLHGERDTERQFGVTIPLRGWSIEATYFVTRARNFFEHNPIGESDLYLPITDEGALIEGRELTVRSPPFWRYGQAHLAYSNQSAECVGAITGGLVVPGTECGPAYRDLDHDQRNTLNLGYNASLPGRLFIGANLSVNSGLSNDGPPSHLSSYTLLDLSVGRNISRSLSLSVTALNVTNRHLLTDNSLTFGGVHWNDPFQLYAELRYRFHY